MKTAKRRNATAIQERIAELNESLHIHHQMMTSTDPDDQVNRESYTHLFNIEYEQRTALYWTLGLDQFGEEE